MMRYILPLCCLLQWSLAAQTPAFKVIGYLPYYRFSWLNDIEFERLTHVNIAFANPDADGNFSVAGVDIGNAVSKAHQKGCKVYISLAGGYLTPDQESAWDNLTLPANRPAFIQKIVQYVQTHQLDGVDIDLEWQYVKSWYSPFILDLKAALTPLNIPLTAALPGSYRYPAITPAALAAFDWINMMVYDLRGPWDPSNPGQHSPYDWAVDCIDYWQNQGVPDEKLTLGVPFYGYDFGVNPVESFNYRGIVNQDPANAWVDNVDQKFWNGIPTIQSKTELALSEVAGIMIWEIGQDAFGNNIQYSLLRAIDEKVDAAASTGAYAPVEAVALRCFPNPADTRLHLVLPVAAAAQVEISDVHGRVVNSLTCDGSRLPSLDVSGLAPGMYLIAVQQSGTRFVNRFVKG